MQVWYKSKWTCCLTRRIKKSEIETPWTIIGDVLGPVLGKIVKTRNARPKNIDAIWNAIVDLKYAKYTRVEKILGDTLYVKVLSGGIFADLVMIGTDDLVAKLQRQGSFPSIKKVVYRR